MNTWYGIGLTLTFVLGVWNAIYNYRNSKKTSFINTVTAERVKWLQSVRKNISSFCGLTYNWSVSNQEGTDTGNKQIQEIDKLRHLIQLQLNPDDDNDKKIVELLKTAITQTHPSQTEQLKSTLDDLIKATQRMLKDEWDKVKAESKKGDLKEASSSFDICLEWINYKLKKLLKNR